jgi:hypothetical protein
MARAGIGGGAHLYDPCFWLRAYFTANPGRFETQVSDIGIHPCLEELSVAISANTRRDPASQDPVLAPDTVFATAFLTQKMYDAADEEAFSVFRDIVDDVLTR